MRPDELFYQFQRSFVFDRRLLPYELAVDRVGARARIGGYSRSSQETHDTLAALDKIAERAAKQLRLCSNTSPAEDIHHFVETALVEYLGPLGYKLHTGRSRNELVATDFRMFVKEAAQGSSRAALARLISALCHAGGNRRVGDSHAGHDPHAPSRTQPILSRTFCWRMPKPSFGMPYV